MPNNQKSVGEVHKESIEQFIAGLKEIEREIISQLRAAGVQTTASNFDWNHGKEIASSIKLQTHTLEIKVQGQSTTAILTREQVKDSAQGIVRTDVTALVRGLVSDLSK